VWCGNLLICIVCADGLVRESTANPVPSSGVGRVRSARFGNHRGRHVGSHAPISTGGGYRICLRRSYLGGVSVARCENLLLGDASGALCVPEGKGGRQSRSRLVREGGRGWAESVGGGRSRAVRIYP
jgi:hypothetical protein